jgi:hypothetical protein
MRLTSRCAADLCVAALAAFGAALSIAPVRAQDFPNRVVKVVNPYVSGSQGNRVKEFVTTSGSSESSQ